MPKCKPEKRSKLKEHSDKRKRRLRQRERSMKKTVHEKMEIANVSRKLHCPVQDSASEIKSSIKKAAAACDREFKTQAQELKEQHHRCKQTEQDFLDRTRMAINDAIHVRKATWVQEIDAAKKLLASAEKKLKTDAHFTEQLRKQLKRERQRSENEYGVLKKIIRRRITVYGSAS